MAILERWPLVRWRSNYIESESGSSGTNLSLFMAILDREVCVESGQ